MNTILNKVEVVGLSPSGQERILTSEALEFVFELHQKFNSKREELLKARSERQKELDAGLLPNFLAETRSLREGPWKVAPTPSDLLDRRVEITGPVERKMMINALNSGARVFMADFEDSLSPTWKNIVEGQINLLDASTRQLSFVDPVKGKSYTLNDEVATILVRPRGWHLLEKNVLVEGKPVSASLFDFGMYFFHNVKVLSENGSAPYFYLPKLENHLEARLWNDVFVYAQKKLAVPVGTIRATVLIETITAAFEMEEILFELKEHASGLNAGRWDYIFSMIKKMQSHPEMQFPDRSQVSMAVPFMRAYTQLMVKTCHHRGAHAIGGMAAFIPSRKDSAINETAFAKVKEDKLREATDGFDGTWVAHPDLVPVAMEIFDERLGDKPHQKDCLRDDVLVTAADLLNTQIIGAVVTRAGLTNNIDVALQYIESWLRGTGAAAIYNLMEDAATAEISRAQVWQWIKNETALEDGSIVSAKLYKEIKDELLVKLRQTEDNKFAQASEILDSIVLNNTLTEFLTLPAYDMLCQDRQELN